MTLGTYEKRAWAAYAAHHRFRDEYAKAYRVVARYPILTIQGGANHQKWNGDIFDGGKVSDADAVAAKQHQDAERRAEMQAVVDGVMGGET